MDGERLPFASSHAGRNDGRITESEVAELRAEMDNFVRNTLDLTNRVDIKWLMDHFPEYAQRILPQFYTVDELGHTSEVLVTPFGAAIIEA